MAISALVVDDERPAREELKRFLAQEADFNVIGEAEDGEVAVQAVMRLAPKVIFLDIRMPKKDGLEVAGELVQMPNPPVIVFVTAFDEHAIEAFELNALDYILKPYDQTRLQKTLGKIRNSIEDGQRAREKNTSLRTYLESRPASLVGRKRNSRDKILIQQSNVLYFHVKLTEVIARTVTGEEYMLNSTLRDLLAKLDANRFQQVHRAYIVNIEQVEKVSPLFSGNFKLGLKDTAHTDVPLSRRYARKLKQFLNW